MKFLLHFSMRGLTAYAQYFMCFLAIGLALSGCGARQPVEPLSAEYAPITTPQSPFQLQVTSVRNDGKNLKVEGVVASKAAWSLSKVSVVLSGYREGREVQSVSKPLSDFANVAQLSSNVGLTTQGPVLPAETPLAFSLSIPAESISDYQVTLGWGDEATQEAVAQVVWEQQSLVDVGVDGGCSGSENCGHYFAVEGSLRNQGKQAVSSVSLKVALFLSPVDNSPKTNLSALDVELGPLSLAPSASQRVRLRLKDPIDPDLAGRLLAEVQVDSVKSF